MNNFGVVVELLEVLKLLDVCVWNGYYDEALDLENFVAKMEATYGDIVLVKRLVDEVWVLSVEML